MSVADTNAGSYNIDAGRAYAVREMLRQQVHCDLPTRDDSVRWLLAHAMEVLRYIEGHGDTGRKWAELRETLLAAQIAERLRGER